MLDGERLGTHSFACPMPGYVGWYWNVTLARVPRSRTATVCETGLLPGEGALLAQAWVPWAERLAPGDLGPTDRAAVTTRADERLIPGHVATGDPEIDRVATIELGLDRERIMTRCRHRCGRHPLVRRHPGPALLGRPGRRRRLRDVRLHHPAGRARWAGVRRLRQRVVA